MEARILLYIPLLSSVSAICFYAFNGLWWFRYELILNFLTAGSAIAALYSGNIMLYGLTVLLFVLFAVIPSLVRNRIATAMIDPCRFRAFHLFKILKLTAPGNTTDVTVKLQQGIISGCLGQTDETDLIFEALAQQATPRAVRELIFEEHLRALALSRRWQDILDDPVDPQSITDSYQKAMILLWQSQALIHLERFSEGLKQTLAALQTNPSLESVSFAQFHILITMALTGRLEELEQAVNISSFISPHTEEVFVWYWKSRCHMARNEVDLALHCLTMAEEANHKIDHPYWQKLLSEWSEQIPCRDELNSNQKSEDENCNLKTETGKDDIDGKAQDSFCEQNKQSDQSADKRGSLTTEINQITTAIRDESLKIVSQDEFFYKSTVTKWLSGLLAVIFAAEVYTGATSNMEILLKAGAFMPSLVFDGDYFRIITAVFLHGSLLHLGFNILGLKLFGPFIESRLTFWPYLALFLITGSVGNLSGLYSSSFMIAVGASGAVMGILGASVTLLYCDTKFKNNPQKKAKLKSLLFLIAANLVIGQVETQIFNGAHIGGFICGMLMALPFCKQGQRQIRFSLFYKLAVVLISFYGVSGFITSQLYDENLTRLRPVEVGKSGFSVKLPLHWLINSSGSLLTAQGPDNTRVMFFAADEDKKNAMQYSASASAVKTTSKTEPETVRNDDVQYKLSSLQFNEALLNTVVNTSFERQKKSPDIQLLYKKPRFRKINGFSGASWKLISGGREWYNVIIIAEPNIPIIARLIAPDDDPGKVELFFQMCEERQLRKERTTK